MNFTFHLVANGKLDAENRCGMLVAKALEAGSVQFIALQHPVVKDLCTILAFR
ncbi:MAG: hypothetical protein JZU70_05120 [Chlorobium sp.]|jgi:hypothetical protein|nr:hypothetical protein [Chlorobium sp.]